jgi:hypothetical protein
MINGLKKIVGIVLLLFVFLGTTGVTFYHHVCACNPMTATVMQHRSCCEPAKEVKSCCSSENHEKHAVPVRGCANHHKGCKDVPSYFTASILGLPVIKDELLKMNFCETDFHFILLISDQESEPKGISVFTAEDPPPITGKQLLFSLHQLKIPFIS